NKKENPPQEQKEPRHPKTPNPPKIKQKHLHIKNQKTLHPPSIKPLPINPQITLLQTANSTYTHQPTPTYHLSHPPPHFTLKPQPCPFQSP
ncbi:hypothetical protein, partial [Bacillus sp. WP8]|uniref:hypothetical protein n=1 Tax=Bacillus sp. WP8 TaxID=756828 RepID=UPI001C92DFF4